MKCRYRFRVNGRIRLRQNVPVPASGWTYEFQLVNGFVQHVVVTVPLSQREHWPEVILDPEPGVKARIKVPQPHLPFIQRELRSLQGLLSLFGLQSIDFESPSIEWVPETMAERSQLQLFTHEIESEPIPDELIKPLSFDLLARAVMAADAANEIEITLSFFRRGMCDVYARNYIEAIYDFYFILETHFADGKFKKAAVEAAFLAAPELRDAVQSAINDPGPIITLTPALAKSFSQSYRRMSVDQAIRKMVQLRGFLHHHFGKRRDAWHPDDQRRYELDALFFRSVAFNVAFGLAAKYLWDDAVVAQYEELCKQANGGG